MFLMSNSPGNVLDLPSIHAFVPPSHPLPFPICSWGMKKGDNFGGGKNVCVNYNIICFILISLTLTEIP